VAAIVLLIVGVHRLRYQVREAVATSGYAPRPADMGIRHVPIVDGGEVVGIVSIGDLVKFISKQQAFEIKYLTDYITGR